MTATKLIILDRDGVINVEGETCVKTPEEWQSIPRSKAAILKLKEKGFTVCVATNQSMIGKKLATTADLAAIHDNISMVDDIFFCPHQAVDNCNCRKPKPGMLLAALEKYGCDPIHTKVPFVGDSDTDLLAANSAGCVPVLVKTGKGLYTLDKIKNKSLNITNLLVFNDLKDFVDYWLK